MHRAFHVVLTVLLGVSWVCGGLLADDATDREIAALKKQLGEIQQRIKALEEERAAARKTTGEPVTAAQGPMKVGALLQYWFVHDTAGPDTFRTRRLEIKLSGPVTPRVGFTAMADFSKSLAQNPDRSIIQSSRILQDAFITVTPQRDLAVDLGQFKIPVSMEGMQSSSALETVERALFIVEGNRVSGVWGDFRDLGVLARGGGKTIGYQAGLFNGEAQNTNDTNDRKDLAVRAFLQPNVIAGLHLGGSYYDGRVGPARVIRRRIGSELRWEQGPVLVKSEYMAGDDGPVHRAGWYLLGGYRFDPKLQGVFRYDRWNPNTGLGGVGETDYTAGLNYYVNGNNAKFQINYIHKNRESQPDSDQILSDFQVAF